jgi:hypothetical protein
MQNGPPTVRHRVQDETESLQKTLPCGRAFSLAQKSPRTANALFRLVMVGGLDND